MKTINKLVGKNLRAIRMEKEITQIEVAKALGVHQSNIARLELGKQSLSFKQAWEVARFYRVSLTELAEGLK